MKTEFIKERCQRFIKRNEHPQGKSVNDCVVRALTTATGEDYLEIRRQLNRAKKELGFKSYKDHFFIDKYLKDYEKLSFKAQKGEPRTKVNDFVDAHHKGTFVLSVRGHVTCVKNGDLIDTWDCGYLSVYKAWKLA